MSKTNARCACGSGKKYKNCCQGLKGGSFVLTFNGKVREEAERFVCDPLSDAIVEDAKVFDRDWFARNPSSHIYVRLPLHGELPGHQPEAGWRPAVQVQQVKPGYRIRRWVDLWVPVGVWPRDVSFVTVNDLLTNEEVEVPIVWEAPRRGVSRE